ncbi:hypothetical protein RhiirC2_725134 [Rhizophagus irregularis]|uniref:Uncharacterized protein n=1 Tax=Rhizophagus irregularis TaxID=588596 RepID=A0A2N1P1W8_9GLOM|nr:hypothetical protein RhiirC2_725134 [Rhizophagus irregularis]
MFHVNRPGPFLERLKTSIIPNRIHVPSQIDEESLPLRIGTNVSIKKFNKFIEYKAPRGYKYQHDDNGNVFIVDMSNTEHARVAFTLGICFNAFNGPGIPAPNRPIVISTDTLHPSPVVSILRRRRKMAPDLAIAPNEPYVPKPTVPYPGPPPSDNNGNSHARIIVELGNHQSVRDWIAKCQLWLQVVYVRYVFAIKLHKPNNARDAQGRKYRAMTARLWTQGAGYREWDFGSIPRGGRIQRNRPIPTTGCIGPGLPAFVVNIPVNEIFFNPPTIPPPAGYIPIAPIGINPGANFTIDLYYIQQEVLMSQRN